MQRHIEAILFSGGLDSVAAAILQPSAALIRVSTRAKYDSVEATQARRIAALLDRTLIEDHSLDLSQAEQADALIPGRNALLALTAARYAENLTLVAVDGDGLHATDKDYDFSNLMTQLMRKLFGRGVLRLPYRSKSKVELASAARRYNRELFDAVLPRVYSCYTGHDVHCGTCKACVRLWAACYAIGAENRCPTMRYQPWRLSQAEWDAVFAGRGLEEQIALQTYRHVQRGPYDVVLPDAGKGHK